ncbi:MAG: YhbY family RNA-binding protein [Candidatus Pacearchaeota archaeon]
MRKFVKAVKFQLGKAGLSSGFIENLAKSFKKRDLVRINVLRSHSRDREEIKKEANKICSELRAIIGKDFKARIIGFTIIIKKQ